MRWKLIDDYDERYFLNYDMAKLTMDKFYLNITSQTEKPFYLYTLNKECFECPYVSTFFKNEPDDSEKDCSIKGSNSFSTNLKFRLASEHKEYLPQNQVKNVICDLNYDFGQFGIYQIHINSNNTNCLVTALKEPVNIYLPILSVVLIYLGIYLVFYGLNVLWRKINHTNENNSEENGDGPKKERIMSLDTFRGITIVLMIFANFGCGGYEIIEHAKWNGIHVADLVFPWFVWIMGVCIPISLNSSFKRNVPNRNILINILKRSLKLICLGIFLGSGTDLNYLRIFGVLQRFSIAYVTVATICLYFTKREELKLEDVDNKCRVHNAFLDVLKIANGWIIVSIILFLHTLLIFIVAAPGCPRGYMGPGGLHKNRSYPNCIGGATGYLDYLILGNHVYQNPTIYETYESKPFDPEGVLGCLTTIFHVFLGVQAGTTLLVYKKHSDRLFRWLSWAVICGVLGGIICGFSKENGLIPVNKSLWSISFVLVTSCFAFFLLSLCYFLVDLRKFWSGKPFLFCGMNAILMYIGHEMTGEHFPVRWFVHNDHGDSRRTHFLALFSDSWAAAFWVLVAYYLFKINYFFAI